MNATDQPALPLFAAVPEGADAEWLVTLLADRDWTTARELLVLLGLPVTENHKRWLRKLADESKGRIAGHQRGYKLVREMTGEEYQHWRNEWLKAITATQHRITEADGVFYGRKAVAA